MREFVKFIKISFEKMLFPYPLFQMYFFVSFKKKIKFVSFANQKILQDKIWPGVPLPFE